MNFEEFSSALLWIGVGVLAILAINAMTTNNASRRRRDIRDIGILGDVMSALPIK